MLKETLCVLLLIGVSSALHPSFKIIDAGSRERIPPYRNVRHSYSDDDDDDDVDAALNSADHGSPYRHSGSGAAAGYDRGLDPLAVRAARLNAYRAALLRSFRADQEFDNQHAARFGGSAAGGGGRSARGGGGGGAAGGRRAPQRDVYEGGNAFRAHDDRQFRRPSAHSHGRGHRGQRTPESRDIDDEGYY